MRCCLFGWSTDYGLGFVISWALFGCSENQHFYFIFYWLVKVFKFFSCSFFFLAFTWKIKWKI